MNNWCICRFFSRIILLEILMFKGLTARRLYKSFSVKGLNIFNAYILHYIWRSEKEDHYMFIIYVILQKLYRFINCVELVSPHHAARELVHTIRQGQITSLFQKSVKRVCRNTQQSIYSAQIEICTILTLRVLVFQNGMLCRGFKWSLWLKEHSALKFKIYF
jgi:hypothetical protein